ncbi:isochorismatase family protein [Bailinhaonella thermotolerans]|uniref:Isochorismatase family protein n=1 Tax=Bailinhaonella thermotolerans TaxID=1070861 RepID=A0A3A4ADD9_9ACTN|nr:isochorismatase family protein [Bailinhaonella thermotolerans]RJL23603.1 isochorismatase family protein [Bailinhaonella thermotolerans]
MPASRITPDDSAILMIDHALGFGSLFRSHELTDHVSAAVAVARTARLYGVPLIVTHGKDTDPPGPIFPALRAELRDDEIVVRDGAFDALSHPGVRARVEAAARPRLILTGLMTEGCVLQTALSAVRSGYTVYVVEDAVAGETPLAHRAAMTRLTAAGVIPLTWLSLATEYQVTWDDGRTAPGYAALIRDHSPLLGNPLRAAS